ncbi:S-adenosyl-L-methionine-dependent methyltransferase [Aspergillus heterothallicus]
MALQSSHTDPSQRALGFQGLDFNWDTYIKYRPFYPTSLYKCRTTDNDNDNDNDEACFATAHDVGAGPGNVAARLSERFARVIVSEPNTEFLRIAQARLSSSLLGSSTGQVQVPVQGQEQEQEAGARDQEKPEMPTSGLLAARSSSTKQGPPEHTGFTFLAESAESSSVASASVDLVVIAEALHWAEIPVAIREFARQLKSGGTLCVVEYGPLWIVDNEAAQKVWEALFCDVVRDIFFKRGGEDGTVAEDGDACGGPNVYMLSGRRMATGFDNVGFPEAQWRRGSVERVFTNTGGDRGRIGFAGREAGLGEESDAVGADEDRRVFVEEDSEWMVWDCDLAWLQGAFVSYVPGKKVEDDRARWDEMARALCGGKVTVAWPSVRILATRR